MQFLKTFGLLLLLTMSNAGIASANNFPHLKVGEDQVEFQFTQDLQELSESTLITPAEVLNNQTFFSGVLPPLHLCSREISRANRYFVYSQTIIPSLDISAIIFPFHTFL